MDRSPALILAHGCFGDIYGKVAHGLVRGTDRFDVIAVIDPDCAGRDAGALLDGRPCGIPIVASIEAALAQARRRPEFAIVGMATHGGRFTETLRAALLEAATAGLSLVNGLHDKAGDDPEIAAETARHGASILDLRRPKPVAELHFWTGQIHSVVAPRIAVLGTDCALGKRTTARLLTQALNADGVRTEMIYTGQTGWMQGGRHGLILDALPNDFVSGELEHAILSCYRESRPDLIVLEGQSALRNPSGPCGAELLLSGAAAGVILQHAPGRRYYDGFEGPRFRIPPVEDEIRLIEHYGVPVLGVSLNGRESSPEALREARRRLAWALDIPVVCPLEDGVTELLPPLRALLDRKEVA
ncbi:MAG: DUF1611 domain-containing protein [Pseudomonadota bacterium]